MGNESAIIELKNITKRFPGVLALDHVNMKIEAGKVHALLGENGAGKSTLMKILSGMYTEYEGSILFEGQEIHFKSEKDALEHGIAIVPQELNPIPELSIAENIYLGREPTNRFGFVNSKKCIEDTQNFMEHLGLDYDAGTKMSRLSVAQKQMVEIIKAISREAKLIIMDEPTSALTGSETEYLFQQIDLLKKKGIAIIFISHKLDEVYRICDTATILRDGQWIGCCKLSEVDEDKLISMMVGREVKDIYPPLPKPGQESVLKVSDLCGEGFQDVSFEVRKGEILGFAGMMGSGRTEIVKSIFGMNPIVAGTIELEGKKLKIRNTRQAIQNGIVMVSEDRAIYYLAILHQVDI